MTWEEIIRMAREAGAMFEHMAWVERDLAPVFERFANLVAAAEREHNYALIETLIDAEREACARVCEDDGMLWGARYAAKIRARGRNEKVRNA